MVKPDVECCEMCKRRTHLTFHHLIPRKVHARRSIKRRFRPEDLAKGVFLCRLCHNALHQFFSEEQLARDYNTLEKLLTNLQVQRHIKWATRQQVQ